MAQVMEALAGESSRGHGGVESMGEVRCIQRSTVGRREDEVLIVPPWPSRQPFLDLRT